MLGEQYAAIMSIRSIISILPTELRPSSLLIPSLPQTTSVNKKVPQRTRHWTSLELHGCQPAFTEHHPTRFCLRNGSWCTLESVLAPKMVYTSLVQTTTLSAWHKKKNSAECYEAVFLACHRRAHPQEWANLVDSLAIYSLPTYNSLKLGAGVRSKHSFGCPGAVASGHIMVVVGA